MKLLSPVSIAVAVALGSASYIALNQFGEQPLTPYEQNKSYLDKKYESKMFNPKRYDKPKEALDFYIQQRLPASLDTLPVEQYSAALVQIKDMPHYSLKSSQVIDEYTPSLNAPDGETQQLGDWQELGPGNIGGRTRALVIHPTEHDVMYAAGVAGGVWKTENAGQTWQPLSDLATNLAVTTLSLDPTNPDIIYAGTGEGFFNADALRGDGIFKSTDAGVTWEQIASTASNSAFHYTNKVVHSPSNNQRIYAATRGGVLRSNDAGESWETVLTPDGVVVGCLDLTVVAHEGNDVLLTSCGSFVGGGVHRSTDNGDTWQAVLDFPTQGRTTLAVAPSDSSIVYALAANINDHAMEGVYKSTDMGATWTATVTRDTADDFSKLLLSNTVFGLYDQCYGGSAQFYNQGWYDNIIAVDPVNPDVVWTGGIDLFRSDDGGQTFAPTSIWWFPMDDPQYAHADQHTIVFHPAYDGVNNTTMFVGNDGGIQRTDNSLAQRLNLAETCGTADTYRDELIDWTTLNNGYAVTQFYHGTVKPNGTAYFGGTQDNGTLVGEDGGFNEWQEIMGGDGGWTAIDSNNPDIMFAEFTGLSLRKSLDAGQTWSPAVNGITGDGFPFITRFEMAPSDSQTLWIGGNQLWRTKDQAENWVAGSPQLNGRVMSIAISPQMTSAVAAGTESGSIYVNYDADNAGADSQWRRMDLGGTISAIAFDPHNKNTIYATVSTFGVSHIWKTVDGGESWTTMDAGLPDIPFTSVVVDPVDSKRVIVGSDLGVFVSVNGGESWMADGSGLANTNIAKLVIKDQELFAFTHGRSVYKVDMEIAVSRNLSISEDSAAPLTRFLVNDQGTAFDSVTFYKISDDATIMLGDEILEEGQEVTKDEFSDLMYVPAENYYGDHILSFEGTLSGVQSSIDINVSVMSVNDVPELVTELPAINSTVGESISLDISKHFVDADGDELNFLDIAVDNALTISKDGIISGSFSDVFEGEFQFEVTDNQGGISQNKIAVSIKESGYSEAPQVATGQVFETDENVPLGTVIGQLEFTEPDPENSPIVAFNVYGNNTFRIDEEGQVIVQNEVDHEYQSIITFTVQAVDSRGNVSNNPRVQVKVNDLRGNDDDDSDGDAGSFGLLALLASPLAFLRRRRK